MDLKRKLARLTSAGPATESEVDSRVSGLRARLERLELFHRRSARELRPQAASPAAPPGEIHATPHGDAHVVSRRLPPEHRHGTAAVRGALGAAPADIAHVAREPRFADVELGRALFVDTETTGLAGGTGTVPFLIGMAWFESESLHVQQLVLPELGREAPMLWLLAERLAAASCVVTYNGKSFDWPLLRNRYVLNRIAAPSLPGHLDLLHCTRRVFRRRLERMRLVGIEQEILGFERQGDIDGALIPLRYFDFLRGVPGATLEPVLEHNHHDIVALAALLGAIGARCASDSCDPREALSLAELLCSQGELERARRFAEQAVSGSKSDALTVEALTLLARLDAVAGEHARAAERLCAALALATPECAPPLHLELAKLYEHRLRDLPAAREHALRATGAEAAEAQARRLGRLERRLNR